MTHSLNETPPTENKRFFDRLFSRRIFFVLLILLPTLAVLGRTVISTRMKVEGTSMLPTYKPNDRFTTYHLAYGLTLPLTRYTIYQWGMPKRGEVITCCSPRRPDVIVLKRVIGLPGDKIYLADGVVYVNGIAIPRAECPSDTPGERIFMEMLDGVTWRTLESEQSPAMNTANTYPDWYSEDIPHEVPDGMVFVLGDHRNGSIDSRYLGDVPLGLVTGKVRE